jgi:penicillin-binding protein 1A
VTRIEAPDGTLLWTQESAATIPAMDPGEAYELTEMLEGVVNYGTGKGIRDYGITGPIAGKTGTTNDGMDVWFVGYTPTLVQGVWFGYDMPQQIAVNASGGRLAAPAWAEIYQAGWREPRGGDFAVPAGMISKVVDPTTGQLATQWCPIRTTQWFKLGAEPAETCSVHTGPPPGQIAIDANGNIINAPGQNPLEQAGRSIANLLKRIIRW